MHWIRGKEERQAVCHEHGKQTDLALGGSFSSGFRASKLLPLFLGRKGLRKTEH
jgi:hypothetical protein